MFFIILLTSGSVLSAPSKVVLENVTYLGTIELSYLVFSRGLKIFGLFVVVFVFEQFCF